MEEPGIYNAESVAEFLTFKFDYVVVGGGTAGLVVASRLAEEPNIKVAVIEAGRSMIGDYNVDSPAGLPNMLHNPDYDWMYSSTPQVSTRTMQILCCGHLEVNHYVDWH
jgi:choline dehydrogenase-like flavoprotein